jgi:hypothetical protein
MEAFPDVNDELSKYTDQQQKYWALYFKMMKALNMGRTHHVRMTSFGYPEPTRGDGTPLTKSSRASRIAVSRRKSKAARLARRNNR